MNLATKALADMSELTMEWQRNAITLLEKEVEQLTDDLTIHIEHEQAQANRIGRFKERIAKLERVYEAATNLVRAEGWQIERDNLWDTLHDLIDAEDEALADMEQT